MLDLTVDAANTVGATVLFRGTAIAVLGWMITRLYSKRASLVARSWQVAIVFTVLSFSVGRRMREFAARSALGANRRSLIALVVRDGGAMALLGTSAGIAGTLFIGHLLQRFRFQLSPADPQVLALATGAVLIIATTAWVLPALRAGAADPLRALQAD